MNQQEELFSGMTDDERYARLIDDVRQLAAGVVADMEYPEGCMGVYRNETKTETYHSLHIRELRRGTAEKVDADDELMTIPDKRGVMVNYICSTIAKIKPMRPKSPLHYCAKIEVNVHTFNAVPAPECEKLKEVYHREKNGEQTLTHYAIHMKLDDPEILTYLGKVMRYRLSVYKSKCGQFGCCHLYMDCSDAKKCIHNDKIFATVCQYRKNLESGRIFYGKNKTI